MRSDKMITSVVSTVTVLILAGCGSSIKNAQKFAPNAAPVIDTENITSTMSDGSDVPRSNLVSGMSAIKISVPAYDPEGKPLKYDFTSTMGSFTDKKVTDDGCTVYFYITGKITGGTPVNVHIVATDDKEASSAVDHYIGTGKSGANVSVSVTGKLYIKSNDDSEITFTANCDGIYQIYCDNTITLPANAVMDDAKPIFRYKKNSGGDYPSVKLTVSGPGSLTDGKAKLKTVNAPNNVWLVFSDNINPDISVKCVIIVDDVIPAVNQRNPASNATGVSTSLPSVTVGFNKPMDQTTLSNITLTADGTPVNIQLGSYSESNNSATFTLMQSLPANKTCTVNTDGVTDLAGNAVSGGSFSFTTAASGQLSIPTATASGASIADGQIFNNAISVTLSSPGGGSIRYTTDGSTPTATSGTVYSGAFNVSKNTTVKAIAYGVSGYIDSQVLSVRCKIRSPKPTLPASVFNSTADITITITPPTDGIVYYTTNEDDPDTNSAVYSSSFLAAGSVRNGNDMIVKAIAVVPGMEPSLVATGEYEVVYPSIGTLSFSLVQDEYNTAQTGTVSFATSVSGYSIAYTNDGTIPPESGTSKNTSHGGSIPVCYSQKMRIIAYKVMYSDALFQGQYAILKPVFIYVANNGSNSISGYAQAPDGTLVNLPGSPFSLTYSPYAIAAHPLETANYIYVSDTTNSRVWSYAVGETGSLTANGSVMTGAGPRALTGYRYSYYSGGTYYFVNHLYSANYNANSISGFTIGTDGKLTTVSGSPWSTGLSGPVSMAVTTVENGQNAEMVYMYVANSGSKNICRFDLNGYSGFLGANTAFSYDAALTPSAITPVYFSDEGDGGAKSWIYSGGSLASSGVIEAFTIDAKDTQGYTTNGDLYYTGSASLSKPITSTAVSPLSYGTDSAVIAYTSGDSSSGYLNMISLSNDLTGGVTFTDYSGSPLTLGASGYNPCSVVISSDSSYVFFVSRYQYAGYYHIGAVSMNVGSQTHGTPMYYVCGTSPTSIIVMKGNF